MIFEPVSCERGPDVPPFWSPARGSGMPAGLRNPLGASSGFFETSVVLEEDLDRCKSMPTPELS
jgi:hypothetical protein